MKLKKIIVTVFALSIFILASCKSDGDDPVVIPNNTVNKNDENQEEICSMRAYIVTDGYSEDWVKALYARFPNHGPFVEGQTKIIIAYTLPSEMDIFCANNDGIVLEVRPDVDKFWGVNYKNYSWYDEEKDEEIGDSDNDPAEVVTENALTPEMMKKAQEEDALLSLQPELNEGSDDVNYEYNSAYRRIGAVMEWVNTSSEENHIEAYQKEDSTRAVTDKDGMTDKYVFDSVPRTASCIWNGASYKMGRSSSTKTDGGSWTVNFKVTPLRVTNDAARGHYLMVEADAKIDNSGMWKGRYHKIPNPIIYERMCSVYLENFNVKFKPVAKKKGGSIYYPVTNYGQIQPDTIIGSTSYSIDSHWDLKFGLKGALEGKSKTKAGGKDNGGEVTQKIEASADWAFGESTKKSYSISDLGIENISGAYDDGHGNINSFVGFNGKVNNCPSFKWSEFRGFTEGSQVSHAGFNMHSTWIWYVETEEDIDFDVTVEGNPVFGVAWWYSTKADYTYKSRTGIGDKSIKVGFPTIGNLDYGRNRK